jgi:signal transduction histidine kinase
MFNALFNTEGLSPHGICILWRRDLFWSLATSDTIIAISYLSISLAITVYLVRRRDTYFRWMAVAVAFALFILFCAASHFSDLWTLWLPDYGAQVLIKAATALVSFVTAVLLWPLIPHVLALPSAAQLAAANTALSHEIDERRAAEASLKSTEQELRAANAELESFAYAVSHDLRAPLRAMTGFSMALMEDFGDQINDEARQYLEEIRQGGQHMGELIDGLLQLSRATRGQLQHEAIDISAMANRIRDEVAAVETRQPVTWQIEPDLTAWGDHRMVEIVLRNLLGNAVKYSQHSANPTIRVYAEASGQDHMICVADNGAGFDMAHAGKLFQPFQRLHRQDEFPGLGIGLSTVSRIVHRHGGSISADGIVGQGATFRFSLPESTAAPRNGSS